MLTELFWNLPKEYNLNEIPYNSLTREEELGKGGSSTVHKANSHLFGDVANKRIDSKMDENIFKNEIKIHREIFSKSSKERIVKIYGASCIITFVDPRRFSDPGYLYDKMSDIYNIGVLMWEIFSNGRIPFSNQDYLTLTSQIQDKGLRETPITGTPEQYIDLYIKMLGC
ncbi:14162_t:CDS:2 [Gigaspora margarita]|uniref:14162_t:CDS:1 n=1 Tax=Gigaspora margarita TaxID=4874 RepID=A0ABN7V2I7_GIGMA|nr:14162_t:CDS:2 [Gigaspora margarita]